MRALLACHCVSVRLSSDASGEGLGAVLHRTEGNLVASKRLQMEDRTESSTFRELQGILFAIESFERAISGQKVVLECDNQGAVSIIAKGSPKDSLHSIAIAVAEKCASINCNLKVVWVPRELNQEADEASRLEDDDNWGILPSIFQLCQARWGNFSVDRFADNENSLCPRFNSKYFVPQTEAVDCFAENWSNDFNWVVPPVALIGPALLFMLNNGFEGVLGVPEWPSSPFYPLLVDQTGRWRPSVSDLLSFPAGTKMFRSDRNPGSAFNQPFSTSRFHFLRIQPLQVSQST